jgi:hypothetical protein
MYPDLQDPQVLAVALHDRRFNAVQLGAEEQDTELRMAPTVTTT